MKSLRYIAVSIALVSVVSLDGCAWTKRMWGKVWGDRDEQKTTQEATTDEQIVTGAEERQAEPAMQDPATTEPMPAEPAATPTPEVAAAPEPDPMPAPPAPEPAPEPAPAPAEAMTLQSDALFAFGQADETGISDAGRDQLDALAAKIGAMDTAMMRGIMVIGHADRIGRSAQNMVLSEQRAQAVKNYLVGKGIDAAMIQTEGRGDAEPKVQCPGNRATKALIACLAPNRRVEVVVMGR